MEYVQKPSSRLLCPICQEVFTNPLISIVCNHSFCASCIAEGLRMESACPLCRQYLTTNELHSNLLIKSITDELVVRCPNAYLGCDRVTTRESVPNHVKECLYALKKCPNAPAGCKFEGSGVSVDTHLKECVFEVMKDFILAMESRILELEQTVQAQRADIEKLQKVVRPGIQQLSTPLDDEEEEIAVMKASSFPQGEIECRRTITDNKTGVTSLAYTSSNLLISGAYDGSIRLFQSETGSLVHCNERAHDLSVWALTVHEPSGRYFSAGSDGMIKVWELGNEYQCLRTMDDHHRKVYSLQVSSERLYSASSDGRIKIWDMESLNCISTIEAHSDCINSVVMLDNDVTKMLSVSNDKFVGFFEFNHFNVHDRTVKLWDITTETLLHSFSELSSEGLDVTSGGGMIFASTFDASIVAFDMSTYSRSRTLRGHNWEVWQLKYLDGVLFSGSHDHTIKRWDLKQWSDDLTLKGHRGYVHSFRFGNSCLISAGADKTIKIWK